MIQGALKANGQVFVVNPNGVLISNGATVNVGSLVASSLDIKDADFIKDNFEFSGTGKGSVINEGKITASESVALLGAGEVSNKGNINAGLGDVALTAGEEITLSFPSMGKINVKINKGSLTALVNNGGIIVTPNGSIALTAWATDTLTRSVINNTGTLEANQMVLRPDGVYLESMGNGNVDLAGQASGNLLKVTGDTINVKDNANLKSKINTHLVATKEKDSHVKLGNAAFDGNVRITADNVLVEAESHELTFTNARQVEIVSGSNDLTLGAKSVSAPGQIKPGKGIISEGLVNAVTKSKAQLSVLTQNGDINLDNSTVDYGNLKLTNNSGNVNVKNSIKGESLNIAGRKFEQSNGAEITMANRFSVIALENISQNGNITAGNSIDVKSLAGNITVNKDSKSTAGQVNYQANTVNLDGHVNAELLSLRTNRFTQGAQSSLVSKDAHLQGGNFDLTLGETSLDSLFLNANSLNLNTNSNTAMAINAYLNGNLNIDSAGDVNINTLSVNGKTNITANNIGSASPWSANYSKISSGQGISLKANNDIRVGNIQIGGRYWSPDANVSLRGENISTGNIDTSGNITAVASNNLTAQNMNGKNIGLQAKHDIALASVRSTESVNINTTGAVHVAGVQSGGNLEITAGQDVNIAGVVSAIENVTISGYNINTASPYSYASVNSGNEMVLTAQNDINVSKVTAGMLYHWSPAKGNVHLHGQNIAVSNVAASGDVKAVASKAITMQYVEANTVNLLSKDDIKVNRVSGRRSVTATSTAERIIFGELSRTAHKELNAAKGVRINYDRNVPAWGWGIPGYWGPNR